MNCIREQWHLDDFDCNRKKNVMRVLKASVLISTAGLGGWGLGAVSKTWHRKF